MLCSTPQNKNRLLSALLVSIAFLLISFPSQADSEHPEVKLGRKEHEKLLETTHFYQDDVLNAYVNKIGQKLAANSHWPDIDYHFFIIDSANINAFALPGGYIYINRGLLSYLTSEAQLAAVLSHEIAHVTRHHTIRKRGKQRMGNAAAILATLATFNTNVGQAIKLENAAIVSGYGREMELEADQYGALYLYRTGYDPAAMLDVLGILKDHERFSTLKTREAGRAPGTYHGVFSTHPKNDKRLREVVDQAGELPPGEDFRGRDIYRKMLDGMVYGDNDTTLAPPGYRRYATESLAVTFVYPEGWSRKTDGGKIVLSEGELSIEITVSKPQDTLENAKNRLKSRFQVEKLIKPKAVYISRPDEGAYALIDTEQGRKRVAAIKSGSYEYFFEVVSPIPLSDEQDKAVVAMIQSFEPAQSFHFPPDTVHRIFYHRLKPGETFADLAADKALGKYTEQQLRLINGYYPTGEPEPGTWIKMAR